MVSVYVKGKNTEALISTVRVLHGLIQRSRNGTGMHTDVVLAVDFNCYNLLWTGDEVSARR